MEDERPATLADIRSLRRWLAVAAVWAVAATALGVIALLKANEDDSARPAPRRPASSGACSSS